jgi:hypothetical protein
MPCLAPHCAAGDYLRQREQRMDRSDRVARPGYSTATRLFMDKSVHSESAPVRRCTHGAGSHDGSLRSSQWCAAWWRLGPSEAQWKGSCCDAHAGSRHLGATIQRVVHRLNDQRDIDSRSARNTMRAHGRLRRAQSDVDQYDDVVDSHAGGAAAVTDAGHGCRSWSGGRRDTDCSGDCSRRSGGQRRRTRCGGCR